MTATEKMIVLNNSHSRNTPPVTTNGHSVNGYGSSTNGVVESLAETKKLFAQLVKPDSFHSEKHFYPRVLNAQIHPLVQSFFSLGNERILTRFAHLNPQVDIGKLRQCLNYVPKFFRWAGELCQFTCLSR